MALTSGKGTALFTLSDMGRGLVLKGMDRMAVGCGIIELDTDTAPSGTCCRDEQSPVNVVIRSTVDSAITHLCNYP
jgi:hypothetical protein